MINNLLFSQDDVEQSIPNRFESIVSKYPHKIAIKEEQITLTYEQLNQKANQIGRYIANFYVDIEKPIIIFMEQGIEFITSFLGVLKMGGFYVPISPSFPREKLYSIIENSQAKIILAEKKNSLLLNNIVSHRQEIIYIDDVDKLIDSTNLNLPIKPETKACIIYTSGSMGEPKGVVHSHCTLLNLTRNRTNGFNYTDKDRIILVYSCHVIGGVRLTMSALCNGGTIFPFNVKEKGLKALKNLLIEEEITVYNSVPTLYRHFTNTLTKDDSFKTLRLIILGGEKVNKQDWEIYKQHFTDVCQFGVSYSLTETGTVTLVVLDRKSEIKDSLMPVGYIVGDAQVNLINFNQDNDEDNIGEIIVKSKYLSLGYWQNSELTNKMFSFDQKEQKKIYHTGDLGKFNDHGCLFHLGRKDEQIQIRGFRVELGEIENNLLKHPNIKETVVIARENEQKDKYLVAYLVTNQSIKTTEIRDYLAQKLPDYMIPSGFVFLDKFPLTPNGKIDKKALPKPDFNSQKEVEFIAPRNEMEIKLAQILQEVLKVEKIGINDNFFSLGGHSLLATQIVSRIRTNLGVELPLRNLFEYPTIAQLGDRLSQMEIMETGEI